MTSEYNLFNLIKAWILIEQTLMQTPICYLNSTHFEELKFKISRIPLFEARKGRCAIFALGHCTNSWILLKHGFNDIAEFYTATTVALICHTTSIYFGKFKIKISRIQLFEARKGRCAFLLWVIAQIRFVNCLLPEREVKTSQKDYPSRKIFP